MRVILLSVLLAVLAACSTTSPDVIQRGDAQRLSQVQDAVVLSIRPVTVEGSQSGIGAAAGAVVGGVAGSNPRNGPATSMIGGVLGAVVGGVAGNALERFGTREQAIEILVQLSNGERRAIVQAQGNDNIQVGDAVAVVTTGGKARVVKTAAAPAPRPMVPVPVVPQPAPN